MREIKFRAWDSDKKRWQKNVVVEPDGTVDLVVNGELMLDISDLVSIERCVGFKDENSQEIYEGDIVLVGTTLFDGFEEHGVDSYGEAKYDESAGLYYVDCGAHSFLMNELLSVDRCEIIGNIHENPELLGVKP